MPSAGIRTRICALLDKARTRIQANLTSAEELEKKFGV
jgi:hypothetical protein